LRRILAQVVVAVLLACLDDAAAGVVAHGRAAGYRGQSPGVRCAGILAAPHKRECSDGDDDQTFHGSLLNDNSRRHGSSLVSTCLQKNPRNEKSEAVPIAA